MGNKMENQILPLVRKKGMAYYIGADGYVYEAIKGNAGRPKKTMPNTTGNVVDAATTPEA